MIPKTVYSIRMYNHAGTLVQYINNWNRLEFHNRLNGSANHQITVEMGINDPRANFFISLVDRKKRDYFILIYRHDPITLTTERVYEGFHTTIVAQLRKTGDLIFNLYGVGYNDLLKRRQVIPPDGLEHSAYSGSAETVIKNFVGESLAWSEDPDRNFPGVTIEASNGVGNYTEFQERYTNLLTVANNIAEEGAIDYGFTGSDPPGIFIFRVKSLWGSDKRIGNLEGNTPVVFSTEFGNMEIPILSFNSSEEKNFVYVGGQGQGVERTVIEMYTDAVNDSPWSRKEAFTDARQQGNSSQLISSGNAYIEKEKLKQTLSFNIRQTTNTRWLRDWVLGDLVTTIFLGFEFNKQIIEIGVTVTASDSASAVEIINVEFEDYVNA